tara:strand:- start:116 stop:367 length:252 start_codon:yes stop_codon:yes gene_type:complete
MPRYIVKEGILDKFLGGVLGAIGKGAAKRVVKLLDKDPVLQKLAKDIDRDRNEMAKRIANKAKKDPEYAKELAAWRKMMGYHI